MKTQFKSNEIAHIWAHKSAPFGKSPGAMSFNGEVFLSYSTALARHITHKGKAGIIYNDRSFSNTTSKHQSLLRRAIPTDVPVFHFDEGMGARLEVGGKELFEYAVQCSAASLKAAETARQRKDYYQGDAARWLERAKFVSEFFGLRRKVDSQTIERLKASSLEAERKEAKRRAQAEEKARIEQTAAFEAWKRGETVQNDYGFTAHFNARLFPVAFRLEYCNSERQAIEGERNAELVSSLGARIPLEDAKRTLAFVTAIRARNESWQRNGQVHRVGHYQLDSITSEGVKAGCHVITWEEVERLTGILI